MPSNILIEAREGWAHVGCPTCGYVDTVPLDRVEEPPYCCHSNRVLWHRHEPSELDWTRMVRVQVTLGEQPCATD